MKLKRIAIDIAKHVFTLHGVDAQERPVLRRNLKRAEMETFFAKLPGTEVVMEACGAPHWARLLTRLGHTVRLIPAQYVKPFVKRAKNDRADAEAINDAASRPGMASVPVKSAERQAELIILHHREMLVGQHTQLINALRGHATEFGVIAGKGTANVQPLLDRLADEAAIPAAARAMFARMGAQIAELDRQIDELNAELLAQHKANPLSRMLAEVPGIGPVTAITLALSIDAQEFASGRHFAAWLGLTPKEHSTGGKQRLGRISKAGNARTGCVRRATACRLRLRHQRAQGFDRDEPFRRQWLDVGQLARAHEIVQAGPAKPGEATGFIDGNGQGCAFRTHRGSVGYTRHRPLQISEVPVQYGFLKSGA